MAEYDGSFKPIIDTYNTYEPLPRGIKMQYNWEWCACFYSFLAIKLGYTEIVPVEISCYYMIEKAKAMGIWVENDDYIPSPGDAILYDWQDDEYGDNVGNPDHIGCVEDVSDGYITVIEGNYGEAVKRRTIAVNGCYIRGFIAPKFSTNVVAPTPLYADEDLDTVAHQVITGLWGDGDARIVNLMAFGYDPEEVQKRVNDILNGDAVKVETEEATDQNQTTFCKVTATEYADHFEPVLGGEYETLADLYLRNGAGKNKKALCVIPNETHVRCYGYYSVANDKKWLYVQVKLGGVLYTGFCSMTYLCRV